MDGQSHSTLANRVNGPQGRRTPDRTRGMREGGISPSFSVMKRRGSELLSCVCRCNDFLKRLARSAAVTQNGLVDHVTALNTMPGPISSPDWSELPLHAMLIHQQAPAAPARNQPVSRMRERCLRGCGFHCPREAGEASSSGVHETLFLLSHHLPVALGNIARRRATLVGARVSSNAFFIPIRSASLALPTPLCDWNCCGPCSPRFSSDSPNFVPHSRRRTRGSAWRRLPQTPNPPFPTTPTKFQLTLSSCFVHWLRNSSRQN